MSYTAGETLILTRLRTISGTVWTSANTAQGKWGILDSGASNHYCIINQGPFTNDPLSLSYTMRRWTTVIELWVSPPAR